MWRALIILILSIGILGGGFYYFADHEGWFDNNSKMESVADLSDFVFESSDLPSEQVLWSDYIYSKDGVLFSSKYPSADWKVVEQLNANELTIIFTNNDSCQVMYLFDIRQGQYKSELSNNKNSESCAEVLRKIVSIATIPQFGVSMDENVETITTTNVASSSSEVLLGVSETNDSNSSVTDTVVSSESSDQENVKVETVSPIVPALLSEGIPDQELHEMTAKERYEGAKTFVNNYLLEYAKRRWASLESQLSAKAKTALGGKSLSSVATPFYYYELLTVLKEIKVGQFQVNVKLTDKEETPIGSSGGVYTLNLVWEYGEWKTDNYLFE